MAIQSTLVRQPTSQLDAKAWAKSGLLAAAVGIAAVLIIQTIAIALAPEIALFKPLDSYARSALFVLVPAIGATAIFAWLVKHTEKPIAKFLILSAFVLLVSIIPDFVLPDPYKTLLASAVTAFLHLVAGVSIVLTLVWTYQRQVKQK